LVKENQCWVPMGKSLATENADDHMEDDQETEIQWINEKLERYIVELSANLENRYEA
jgi:hypothetical protein